jgi:hypothetical protein
MILTSYHNARPTGASVRRRNADPSMRRFIHGPIQSMDEDRTFLWRLFHTHWLKRLIHLDPEAHSAADVLLPACAIVEIISGTSPRPPNGPGQRAVPEKSIGPTLTSG